MPVHALIDALERVIDHRDEAASERCVACAAPDHREGVVFDHDHDVLSRRALSPLY